MTTKAVRAQIKLGDIELDVFQLPDETYRMSAKQVTEVIGIRHSRVAQISATKQVQSLMHQGLEVADFSPIKLTTDNGKASGYPLNVASLVWQFEAAKGNEAAQALAFACTVEALERRADAAFEIVRTEKERNDRFIVRKDSILQRHFWTDTIKDYMDNHPEISNSAKQFMYANVSDALNQGLFGMTAKTMRTILDMDKSEAVRDCIHPALLRDVEFVERYAAVAVRNGCEPMQAVKMALAFFNAPIKCPKTGKLK